MNRAKQPNCHVAPDLQGPQKPQVYGLLVGCTYLIICNCVYKFYICTVLDRNRKITQSTDSFWREGQRESINKFLAMPKWAGVRRPFTVFVNS